MSPEYKGVLVPPEKAVSFEAYLKEIGGSFGSKWSTQDELRPMAEAIWVSESNPLRQQVHQFSQPQTDQVIEDGINKGVARLLSDAFAKPLRDGIDLSTVRKSLANIFTADLPDSLPDYMKLLSTPKGKLLSAGKKDSRFSPREIDILLQVYGLCNGRAKRDFEIAKDFGFSQSTLNQIEFNIPQKIRNRLIQEMGEKTTVFIKNEGKHHTRSVNPFRVAEDFLLE